MTHLQGWVRQTGIGLALALVLVSTLAAQVDAASPTAPPAPGANGHRGPHIMPVGLHSAGGAPRAGVPGAISDLGSSGAAPAGAHLTYNGGRVVSSIQIIQVLWGSGNYLAQTSSTGTPSVASFFQDVFAGSTYDSWLDSEYNTVNNSFNGTKTNQHISAGRFVRQVTITPSVTSTTVDDSTIQSEISAQIAAGHLPAPSVDGQGNATSVYALFFPHGITITEGGSVSLSPGGFCAYHGSIAASGSTSEFYYTVLPDLVGVSGCGAGNDFQNTTSVMSHELTETITDAEVGLAGNGSGPPLAWYDNTNGEIGDICTAQQGNLGPMNSGQTYTVQLEFSNAQSNCILPPARPIAATPSDFSLSANPSAITISAGGSGSTTISTSTTSGASQAVSLSVSGAPAGVSATLSPSSLTSGQSATLNIASAPSTAAGAYSLTVTGTAPSGSHATSVALTVTGGTAGGGISNGGFETGTVAGWSTSGASATVVNSGCQSGQYCAQLGSTSPTNGDSTITQTFTAPSNSSGISLWYKMTCPDTVTYDWALATLNDNTAGTTATLIAKVCTTNNWTNVTGPVTAGHSYTLSLTSHDDNYSGDPTFTLYDNVTITTGSGTGSGVANGGFESGSFAGWTTSGASSAIVNSGCYSGTSCARLGATTPTNGDSNAAQTFTVPSGKSQLSVWYKMTCPDTVTYDWATVTLKNNGNAATTTVLAKTCVTTGWLNVTAAVSAGTSYTLTLTSHDDNYSGDPTFTLYDDVTLN